MKFVKNTREVYSLKGVYKTDIMIDSEPGSHSGRLNIVTHSGTWSCHFGACGRPIKEFLTKLDDEYLMKNLSNRNWFNAEATARVYEDLFKPNVPKKELSQDLKSIRNCNSIYEFAHVMANSELFRESGYEYGTVVVMDFDPSLTTFMKNIWPKFIKQLKEEMDIN